MIKGRKNEKQKRMKVLRERELFGNWLYPTNPRGISSDNTGIGEVQAPEYSNGEAEEEKEIEL